VADRVVLHVGTMKSGTTYLQAVLASGALEEVGSFYPGGKFGAQTRAVRRLLRPVEQRQPEAWDALAADARKRPGVAVYSQEFLSFARRTRVQQIVESFGGTPVEVVLTVRDQRSAIAAQWQSFTRNRGTDDFATYVRRLRLRGPRRRRSKAAKSFRRAQDVPGILRRWTGHEGITSVTVVLVPPPGSAPAELWHRFCAAAGLEAHDPPAAAVPANESLGYASCDALRRLNVHLGRLEKGPYRKARKRVVSALLPLRPEEGRPVLDVAGQAFAAGLNRAIVDAIAAHDVRLVGALEELPVDPPAEAPEAIAGPDDAQVLRALHAAWTTAFPKQEPPTGTVDEVAARLGRRLARRHGNGKGGRRGGRGRSDPAG
jgi:hypothetical protein